MLSKKNQEFINELLNNYEEEMLKEGSIFLTKPIIYELQPDDPVNAKAKCYNCNFEGNIDISKITKCPNCSNQLNTHSFNYNNTKKVGVIYYKYVPIEEGFVIIRMNIEENFTIDECYIESNVDDILYFNNNELINFCYEMEWKRKKPSNNNYYRIVNSIYKTNISIEEENDILKKFNVLFKNCYYPSHCERLFTDTNLIMKIYNSYQSAIQQNEIKKVVKRKVVSSENINPNFNIISTEEIEKILNERKITSFENIRKGLANFSVCKNCGHEQPIAQTYYRETKCPNCNHELAELGDFYFLKNDVDLDGNITISTYVIKYNKEDLLESLKYNVEIISLQAVIYVTNNKVYFLDKDKNIGKTSDIIYKFKLISSTLHYGRNKLICDKVKFIENLKNSKLNRTGYMEFLNNLLMTANYLEQNNDNEYNNEFIKNFVNYLNYLAIYNSFNGIEQLSKCNMTTLIKNLSDKISCPRFVNKKATKPNEILKLTKGQFKELKDQDASQSEIEYYLKIIQLDPLATFNDCGKFLRGYNTCDVLLEILSLDIKKINMKELNKYIESLDDYQCMDWQQGLSIWKDYLNMCIELQCDMNDRSVIFTNNLKLEHDRAVRKFNSIKNQIAAKNFEEAVANYSYLEYESDEHDFIIKTPKTQEELFEEGRKLHHCVGSYTKSVSEGRSTILFIRRKSNPDEPLCTVEINNKRLVQARTKYNNHAYTVYGVKKFMQSWAKENNIKLNSL